MKTSFSFALRQRPELDSSDSMPTSPLLAFSEGKIADDSRRWKPVFEGLAFGEHGSSQPSSGTPNSTGKQQVGLLARDHKWRRVLLKLSDAFAEAALQQPHLAPVLFEILNDAYEYLFLFGCEDDVEKLEEWLNMAPVRS